MEVPSRLGFLDRARGLNLGSFCDAFNCLAREGLPISLGPGNFWLVHHLFNFILGNSLGS